MSVATVDLQETNGSGSGSTTLATSTHMGSTDTPNMTASSYPITVGTNSFEKWHKIWLTAKNTAIRIQNFKVWAASSPGANVAHKTNVNTSAVAQETYNQASATDRSATYHYTQTMPTSTPGTANIGVGGSLSGTLSTNGTGTDFILMQMQVSAGGVGATFNMNYQFDEVV